ncbi:MAG: DNA polymerase III subunit gamma/tau [Chlamydiae bacterium]|nr:DNA polymerase III subunit gamma/tau [Chlamydiota bacterium]MBI3278025.1 DNA polymerase III subunit gamma/tau [Chlamydiota bacterium]
MSYLVLARKWRPQKFKDVVGQAHVVTTLENAITMNRVAHAYLFSGSRGIGKTSIARIFAKALNCIQGPTSTPCNQCSHCEEIASGTSLDVLEIDGASNRGIDQVRELRENVKFAPSSSRFKIYIIDEVHMLTTEAFNALLKTLEEPPSHIKFFFATTESHRVPSTILSRCQRFDLRKIATGDIFEHLKKIVISEKVEADEKTLFRVAKEADGSLRDAESLLDQLISFSGGKLRYEEAIQIFGWIPREEVIDFVDEVKDGDWESLFSLIKKMDGEGKDLAFFIGELSAHFRDLLVIQLASKGKDLIELFPEEFEKAKIQSQIFLKDQLLQMLDETLEVENRLKQSVSKRSMLEALSVQLYLIGHSQTLDQLIIKIEALRHSKRVSGVTRESAVSSEVKKNILPDPQLEETSEEEELFESLEKEPEKSEDEVEKLNFNQWQKVLENFAQKQPLIHAYLKETSLRKKGNTLQVVFPQDKKFSLEALQKEQRVVIQDEVKKIGGPQVSIEFVLSTSKELEGKSISQKEEVKSVLAASIQDDPVLQKALQMFEGKITEIKR